MLALFKKKTLNSRFIINPQRIIERLQNCTTDNVCSCDGITDTCGSLAPPCGSDVAPFAEPEPKPESE